MIDGHTVIRQKEKGNKMSAMNAVLVNGDILISPCHNQSGGDRTEAFFSRSLMAMSTMAFMFFHSSPFAARRP